jgi:transposase
MGMSTAAPLPDPVCCGNVPLPTPEQLPDDPETLKRMILELLATLHQERQDKAELRQRLDLLLRRLYGPRSERINPDQLLLFAEGAAAQESAAAAGDAAEQANPGVAEQPTGKRRRCKPHGRRRLPDNLQRRPVHYQLSEAERICVCGQVRIDIGTEISEQLDWQPASYFVWQHLIHKYLCPSCAGKAAEQATAPSGQTATTQQAPGETSPTDPPPPAPATTGRVLGETLVPPESIALAGTGPVIVSAAKPAMPIDKGLPGPGLLAHIIVSKYYDHLPLYRQENIFARQGVPLARSTTCDWMAACAELLRPLYERMVAVVLQSRWMHTDDTPVKNLGHEPGTTATARFWLYYGDRDHPCNVFDFTLNRKRDGPQHFLADFHGYLHADAFTGYDALYLPAARAGLAPIIEVGCNAHARRKFYDARGSDAARSHQALAYYAQLYEIERRATQNGFDDGQRLQLRQDLAVPVLEKFHGWLLAQRGQVVPKSPLAEAIGYALNNWTALIRYTEAGFLAIDNNVAEREMKRIAIGRKNWLFVGSDKGGRTAAVLFSFTSTCHRLGIEPWAYLRDVLTRLPGLSAKQLDELLPHRWQAARQQAASAAAAASAASAISDSAS